MAALFVEPGAVASYVGAMVRGLQGPPDASRILQRGKVIASTKHFLADGGTDRGVDQGDATIGEEALRDIRGAPYGPATEEGVATVMVRFSNWQGINLNCRVLRAPLPQAARCQWQMHIRGPATRRTTITPTL